MNEVIVGSNPVAILIDLWSVLMTYMFGNSLLKTSFEASVIRSN